MFGDLVDVRKSRIRPYYFSPYISNERIIMGTTLPVINRPTSVEKSIPQRKREKDTHLFVATTSSDLSVRPGREVVGFPKQNRTEQNRTV
jgi:hypothetical protein